MIVAVIMDFNFGALGIGVKSIEKRSECQMHNLLKGAFDAVVRCSTVAFNMILMHST